MVFFRWGSLGFFGWVFNCQPCLDVLLLGEQQAHKDGDGARLDDTARLLARPGGDVGERPGRLELLLTAGAVFRHFVPTTALWNRNYFLRLRFRLFKSYGSGSDF